MAFAACEVVSELVEYRGRGEVGDAAYRVRYAGFETTKWEPAGDVEAFCPDLVAEFWAARRGAGGGTSGLRAPREAPPPPPATGE